MPPFAAKGHYPPFVVFFPPFPRRRPKRGPLTRLRFISFLDYSSRRRRASQRQRRMHLLGQDDLRRRAAERTRHRHATPAAHRSGHFGLGERVRTRRAHGVGALEDRRVRSESIVTNGTVARRRDVRDPRGRCRLEVRRQSGLRRAPSEASYLSNFLLPFCALKQLNRPREDRRAK